MSDGGYYGTVLYGTGGKVCMTGTAGRKKEQNGNCRTGAEIKQELSDGNRNKTGITEEKKDEDTLCIGFGRHAAWKQ